LDIMMPGFSGYDVLERIKQDPSLEDIPIIMITAAPSSKLRAKGSKFSPMEAAVIMIIGISSREGSCLMRSKTS
ncbi:MAG TPA: response regulator, partial [Candidatus Cloacimonetes bacterium]|nr:response regulator [Candidatus Cloacimonadota bacterium]